MSRWREFGFPDLAGTPIQTALEGLYLAGLEKSDIYNSYAEQEQSHGFYQKVFHGITPVCNAVLYVYNLIEGFYTYHHIFRLPDGRELTKKNTADFIGEELIDIPRIVYPGVYVNLPWKDDLYKWAMQCYRILNQIYLVQGWETSIKSFRQYHHGTGKSFSEAASNGEVVTDEYANWSFSLWAFCSASNDGGYTISRELSVPVEFSYQWYKPGDIYLVSNASRSDPDAPAQEENIENNNYQLECFDSFGLQLPFKERKVLTHIPLPDDVRYEDTIKTGFKEKFNPDIKKILPDVPPAGYGSSTVRCECDPRLEYWYDFRNRFKFYDPIDTGE